MNCLLLYNIYSPVEAEAVSDNIRSLVRHSRHRVCPVWMIENIPAGVDIGRFDAIIIHYSIKVHYDFFMSPQARQAISQFPGLKLLIAQDEYYTVDRMNVVVGELGIHAVFTATPESEVNKVYPPDRLPNLQRYSVLTGYVPDYLPHLPVPPWNMRDIDVGYRARKLSAWFGMRGQEKWIIGKRFGADARQFGLKVDISSNEADRLYGQDWIRFLSGCKATLGTESGGSVLDFTGEIQAAIERHEAEAPGTPFEVLQKKYLAESDGMIAFNAISPRCFEAASLRTLMILYPGWYSGVLEAWRHYVPLNKDHSNMSEVVAALRDQATTNRIVDTAYREVALNPAYSYATFVKRIDDVIDQWPAVEMPSARRFWTSRHYPVLGLVARIRWHRRSSSASLLKPLIGQAFWRWRRRVKARKLNTRTPAGPTVNLLRPSGPRTNSVPRHPHGRPTD